MTIVASSTQTDYRCTSFSRSRDRDCLAYGRYECRSPECGQRSCGLHVIRDASSISCPRCGGPVRTTKH